MHKSITCLLTAMTLVGIQTSPWTSSSGSAHEHQIVKHKSLIAQSLSTVPVTDIKGFKGVISNLGVSPDGNILIVASNDGEIAAIDLQNFETVYSLPLKANPYSDIAFSSDGNFFAVAQQQNVFVYQTDTGDLIRTLKKHTGNISSVAISPDDRILVSASGQDLTLKIWDLQTGNLWQDIGENVDSISSVTFHPNTDLFVTGAGGVGSDRRIKYWKGKKDILLGTVPDDEESLERLPTYELIETLPKQFGFIYDLTFDSQGSKLLGAVRNYVKVWDVSRSNTEIMSLKASSLELNRVAISPDDRLIATANREGKITIIDLNRKEIIGTLVGHEGWIQAIQFSPDGRFIYSGAEDKIVKIWDLSDF